MKNTREKNSGVTLIVLVITIIILLLLAGIVISQITQNQLFTNVKIAKEKNIEAQLKEEIELVIMDVQIEEISKGKDVTLQMLASEQLSNRLENITTKLINNEIIGQYKGYAYKIDRDLNVIIKGKEYDYTDTILKADKRIYISAENGDDLEGNGTKENPYATLDKIGETGIIENEYSYDLILMDGIYELTTKMFDLNCNREINIIGNKEDTILIVNSIYSNYFGGKDNYVINFYRLVWKSEVAVTNAICPYLDMNFYNIVFDIDYDAASLSYFLPYLQKSFKFYNCTMTKVVTAFLRCDTGTIQLTNCYGGFTSGYGTTDSMWNYQTNYITETPNLSQEYRILDDESIWKNVGTGTNLDGTQADLGVFGGGFSWNN